MKNFVVSAIVVAISIFGLVTACSVSFPDDGEPGRFPCESSDDCIEGQVCEENENGTQVCKEPGGEAECQDQDGDGYGAGEDRTNCPACLDELRNGCAKDCDDNNDQIHPGKFENCDGLDNDCDGMTDEPAGTPDAVDADENNCGGEIKNCPLPNSQAPQSDTQFSCKTVDGTPQCVVSGNFSASDACQNTSGQKFGTCEGGSWTEVPCECRTGDENCGG